MRPRGWGPCDGSSVLIRGHSEKVASAARKKAFSRDRICQRRDLGPPASRSPFIVSSRQPVDLARQPEPRQNGAGRAGCCPRRPLSSEPAAAGCPVASLPQLPWVGGLFAAAPTLSFLIC